MAIYYIGKSQRDIKNISIFAGSETIFGMNENENYAMFSLLDEDKHKEIPEKGNHGGEMNTEDIVTKKDLLEMEQRIMQALLDRRQDDDCCLTIDQAVAYIGAKGRSTIYKLTHSGQLAYHKVGKNNAFRKADLDRYLARHRKSSDEELATAAALRSVS